MAEPPQKKRLPNFTDEELHALIAAVICRKEILFSKFDSKITAQTKNPAWEFVAQQVNVVSRVHRDLGEIRKKFSDYRAVVKKNMLVGLGNIAI